MVDSQESTMALADAAMPLNPEVREIGTQCRSIGSLSDASLTATGPAAFQYSGSRHGQVGRKSSAALRGRTEDQKSSERRIARASRPMIDGTRLSGFIYGTVTGLVALGGAGFRGDYATWWEIASRVVLGAAAVWVSHAYSELLSHRVVSGRRLELRELGAALSSSWPIVIAGLLLAAPLVPAGFGVVSVETATNASRVLGVTILALIGLDAEQTGEHRWGRRLLHAGLSAGLGLAVVGAELLVHH